jgi:[acyl-carrier-protein] S-malonyltransferase
MTNAALAQQSATVIGWVDNQPIPKTLLDNRLALVRAGKGAAALPAPDTREGRQLVRWTAHVLFTEHVCAAWAREHKLPLGIPAELDALSAIQLGSITAAAWRTHPAVSAVYRAVVGDDTETTQPDMARQWLLRIATGPRPEAALAAEPVSIGWTTLDDLPVALAAAARNATPPDKPSPTPTPTPSTAAIPPNLPSPTTPGASHPLTHTGATRAAPHPPTTTGATPAPPRPSTDISTGPAPFVGARVTPAAPSTLIGSGATATAPHQHAGSGVASAVPVAAGGAWHVVIVDEVDVRPVAGPPPVRRAGTALRAFARWLDQERARSVRVADGFEHPGDPRQPDNTHQH